MAAALRPEVGPSRPPVPEALPLFGQGADELPDAREWLDPWLAAEETELEDVLDAISWLLVEPAVGGAERLTASLERSIRDEARRELATLVVRVRGGDEAALARLLAIAGGDDPPRYANYALGAALPAITARAEAFEREARLFDSTRARRHALETHAALGDEDALERLLTDPAYASIADARISYIIAEQRLDWVGLLLWTGPAQYASVSPVFIALGVASGIVWLLFLAYAGEVRSIKSARSWLCISALVLGALSTVPTIVLSVWMEDVLGVERSTESLQAGVAYFVASVGLREELCKLVFFLPLAPIVIRRRDPLEMLVVAGCVGLGFAAEENISYFAASGGGDAAGRFLTANFGHVVDTGLIGFAFCRMWTEPKRVTDFFLIFVLVVIGHGVYDALIVLPSLASYSTLAAMVYVAVAYVFFAELEKHARSVRRPIPLTAVFVWGFATLLALSLAGAAWELGFMNALAVMVPGTLGAALFVFVFFRQMDEPLLP